MTDTMNLDRRATDAARDEGMARADENALGEWKAEADRIIEHVARTQSEVVSDDVWAAGLGANPTGSSTALGPRFRVAASKGLISKTDRVRRTELESSHASPMTVWASMVFEGERVPEAGRAALADRAKKAAGWIEGEAAPSEANRKALADLLRDIADSLGAI